MSNENFLREFMQKVWNEKDFDSIKNYVAPGYTIHSDSSDPWEGRTLNHLEYAMRLDYSFDSFPDINFEIQTAVSHGDYVTTAWIMTGTNNGKNGAFPRTNRTIRIIGSTVFHFRNGKISGHSQLFDKNTIMKQLGFIK